MNSQFVTLCPLILKLAVYKPANPVYDLWIGYEWTYVKSFVAEELQRPSDLFVLTVHNEGACRLGFKNIPGNSR